MATEFSKLHRVDGRTGAMLPRIKKVVSAPPVGSHTAVQLHPNQYVCTLGILTLGALTGVWRPSRSGSMCRAAEMMTRA